MKIWKNIAKYTALFLGSILVTILLIWIFPQSVITTKSVKWLAQKQSYLQFEPEFPKDFEIHIRNVLFVKQKVHVRASNFCIKTTDQMVHACFDEVDFATQVNFKKFSLMFDSIGPVHIASPSIEVKISQEKKQEKKKDDGQDFVFPDVSKDFELHPIEIDLPKIQIQSGETNLTAFAQILGKSENDKPPYHLNADIKMNSSKDPKNMNLLLSTNIDSKYNIDGTLNVHVGSEGKKPNVDLDSTVKGNIVDAKGEIAGEIKAAYVAAMLPLVEVHQFKIVKDEKLTAEGDFNIELLVGSLNEPKKSALPPPDFNTTFSGKIQAERSRNQPISFDIEIKPQRQYGLVAQAKTKGRYDSKQSNLRLDAFLLDLKIEDFQETVRGLQKTQMAIPAPINDLKGSIHFRMGDEKLGETKPNSFSLPIEFVSDLRSTQQSLVTKTQGNVDIETKPFKGNLKLDVSLDDIAIKLPDFDPISKIPTVIGDKRFVQKKNKEKKSQIFSKKETQEPSAFTTDITIKTPQKPIRIFYKLFKPSAIFRVESHVGKGDPDFNVKFEPFEVSYLKRTAKLERLNISNDEKAQSIFLDGRFSIKKADYMLYADVHQENKKSSVTLTSNPPLSEDDIISLMLFNELSSDLDSVSTDSVQDTQAAMTKKTIGFLSFFVLASTPVESVNYDPTTEQYSARIKLPGGFTGTVGSDWDKAQEVGLRKRLGGKFVISAGVGTDAEGEQRQETMIEWYHRY